MHYICNMFKHRVQKYIECKKLLLPGQKVLVALSGGADSVALLSVLSALGYRCIAAHCNFHLRGEESDRDEGFVKDLCKRQSITLHTKHFNTTDYAYSQGISIEMAARELRYQWFEELRKEVDACAIAVAHHRDDSVETILLNLIRGTGIDGLRGIRAKNGSVIRPLLEESRESILDYLQHIGQPFVTDSTNLQNDYTRNKIRLEVIPMLQTINPSVLESISASASYLDEVAEVYHQERQEAMKRVMSQQEGMDCIYIHSLLQEAAPMSLLHEILSPLGFNSSQVTDIYQSLEGHSGRKFVSTDYEVLRDRDYLMIRKKEEDLQMPTLTYELVDITPSFNIPRDKRMACLDASKVKTPLEVRLWENGDRFVPLGMKGKKLVSDYLTDRKFSLFQKERQCVACCEGQIVWLVGERIDQRYAITPVTTQAWIITIKE